MELTGKIVSNIQDAAITEMSITKELYNSRTRLRKVVIARQISHWLAHKYADRNTSLREIGNKFGRKDHSTVIYSLKMIENYKYTNDPYWLCAQNAERHFLKMIGVDRQENRISDVIIDNIVKHFVKGYQLEMRKKLMNLRETIERETLGRIDQNF